MTSRSLSACLIVATFVGRAIAEDRPNYKVLAEDKGHVMVINAKGEVEWEIPCPGTSHDIAMLPSGNYLIHLSDTVIEEFTPDKKVVWKHVSKRPSYPA